eukprot:scaffold28117_cov56-Attheya_sp.AAC.13
MGVSTSNKATTVRFGYVCIFVLAAVRTALASANDIDSIGLDQYTFEQYLVDFDKKYEPSTDQWIEHESQFYRNIKKILSHNEDNGMHRLGVNAFTDGSDLPLGYDKSLHHSWKGKSADRISSSRKLSVSPHEMDLPFDVDTVDKLPSSIDWRESKVVTEVRNQGGCGSCWAFSAIEVLESHVALQTGNLLDLSEQELLSCMSNPRQCGGNGGCTGANAELAYDFVAKMGIVTDADMTYVSANGTVPACALDNDEKYNKEVPKGALVGLLTNAAISIEGFSHIPTNDYVTLMNAVAKAGPVVVAVAASDWGLYKEGIFTDDGSQSADINHGVALVGYGTDEELGEDYWLVRNSWGKSWGEDGYIRLRRTDPSILDNPDDDCILDVTPLDGTVCAKDETGKTITPVAVKVCGTSGILFDGVIPVGGREI